MKILLLFLIFCIFFQINAEESLMISLEDLKEIQESVLKNKVRIKGFVYPLEQGQSWIISSQPNLRSCCIGTHSKSKEQVILDASFGKFSSDLTNLQANQIIEFEGNLKRELVFSCQGDKTYFYVLHNWMIIQANKKTAFFTFFAIATLVSIACLKLLNKKDKFFLRFFQKVFQRIL